MHTFPVFVIPEPHPRFPRAVALSTGELMQRSDGRSLVQRILPWLQLGLECTCVTIMCIDQLDGIARRRNAMSPSTFEDTTPASITANAKVHGCLLNRLSM